MVIKLTVGKSGYTENFIVKLWEAESDTPGAFVFDQTLVEKNAGGVPTVGAGHQISEAITANGMDKVVHICRIIGAVSGIEYTKFNIEPETPIVTVFLPVRFRIGDGQVFTPAEGDTSVTIVELVGLNTGEFIAHRNGVGALHPGWHFNFNSGSGEIELAQDGDQFGPAEEWTIDIKPIMVSTIVNDSVVGKLVAGFVDVAANTPYNATHLRKMIRFSGSPEYEFLLSPPIGYIMPFNHFGANGTAKIKFTNGALLWGSVPKSELDIPKYTEGAFIWDGANWNTLYLCDSRWANLVTVTPAASIVAMGTVAIGDVPGGDPIYVVEHNKAIVGDYDVFLSIKTNGLGANYFRNNKTCSTWWHHDTDKPNKFKFSLQEVSGEVQDLSINWMIIKAN